MWVLLLKDLMRALHSKRGIVCPALHLTTPLPVRGPNVPPAVLGAQRPVVSLFIPKHTEPPV